MNPTLEQKAIIESNHKIILVNAFAGAGKTSTLIEFCRNRKNKKFLYLCYNNSMRKEAQKKFKNINVDVKTFHSLAYSSVGYRYKNRIRENKKLRLIDLEPYFSNISNLKLKRENVFNLFHSLKFFINSSLTLDELKFIPYNLNGKYSYLLMKIWEQIVDETSNFPFEQDFYLKLYELENPKLNYDYILVDEAQDLNPVMFSILRDQTCKKIFIGDTFQRIYGFRQCINALKDLSNNPLSQIFYLTETFRCPKEVVDLANQYLLILGANKPMVTRLENKSKRSWEVGEKFTFISRTNAKILLFVSKNMHSKFHFVGGIEKYKFQDIADIARVFSRNEEAKNKIKNPFFKDFYNSKDRLLEYLRENPEDIDIASMVKAFYVLLANKINIFKLINGLKQYPEKEADIVLTTAHKSKGLEWNNVLLADDFFQIVKNDQEIVLPDVIPIEDLNLLYVAITRAKEILQGYQIYEVFNKNNSQQFNEKLLIKIRERLIDNDKKDFE